ncbi:hypothetical protein J1614_005756 [Plenodomus biglobosus]|nr:hypothetical protein J1614_005756 [Plenodomus biglobosus]
MVVTGATVHHVLGTSIDFHLNKVTGLRRSGTWRLPVWYSRLFTCFTEIGDEGLANRSMAWEPWSTGKPQQNNVSRAGLAIRQVAGTRAVED